MIDCSAAGQAEPEPVHALIERWMPTGHIAPRAGERSRTGAGPARARCASRPSCARCWRCSAQGHYGGIVAVEPFDYVPDGPGCAARAIGYLRGIVEGLQPHD